MDTQNLINYVAIIVIILILCYFYKNTLSKIVNSVKAFFSRNMPNFNFIYI